MTIRHGVAHAASLATQRSEIAALHGTNGQLEEVIVKGGERLRFSFLFVSLGAIPGNRWLEGVVGRDDDGSSSPAPPSEHTTARDHRFGSVAADDVRSGQPVVLRRPPEKLPAGP